MKFKAGDIVKVKNWGKRYTTNTPWFKEHYHDLDIDWIIRYAYNDKDHANYTSNEEPYKVLYCTDDLALITEDDSFYCEKVYLISTEGIKLANPIKEMKLSEVENILGYRVKIISDESEDN